MKFRAILIISVLATALMIVAISPYIPHKSVFGQDLTQYHNYVCTLCTEPQVTLTGLNVGDLIVVLVSAQLVGVSHPGGDALFDSQSNTYTLLGYSACDYTGCEGSTAYSEFVTAYYTYSTATGSNTVTFFEGLEFNQIAMTVYVYQAASVYGYALQYATNGEANVNTSTSAFSLCGANSCQVTTILTDTPIMAAEAIETIGLGNCPNTADYSAPVGYFDSIETGNSGVTGGYNCMTGTMFNATSNSYPALFSYSSGGVTPYFNGIAVWFVNTCVSCTVTIFTTITTTLTAFNVPSTTGNVNWIPYMIMLLAPAAISWTMLEGIKRTGRSVPITFITLLMLLFGSLLGAIGGTNSGGASAYFPFGMTLFFGFTFTVYVIKSRGT